MNTFKGLSKLSKLRLNSNNISTIDDMSFTSLENLRVLWLNNNSLKKMDSNTFSGLGHLERIFLNNNKLDKIDRKCFEPLKSIKVIEIYQNSAKIHSYLDSSIRSDDGKYNEENLNENGFYSDLNEFLDQFN